MSGGPTLPHGRADRPKKGASPSKGSASHRQPTWFAFVQFSGRQSRACGERLPANSEPPIVRTPSDRDNCLAANLWNKLGIVRHSIMLSAACQSILRPQATTSEQKPETAWRSVFLTTPECHEHWAESVRCVKRLTIDELVRIGEGSIYRPVICTASLGAGSTTWSSAAGFMLSCLSKSSATAPRSASPQSAPRRSG